MVYSVLQYLASSTGLSLVAGFPLMLLGCCCFPPLRAAGFRLLPFSAIPALMAALIIDPGTEVQVGWFFMGSAMGLDETGRTFLLLTSSVWLFASISVFSQFESDPRRCRFTGYFLASMSGNLGLVMAQDILGFYLFFSLMSFSAYGLIVHSRTSEGYKAGRVYLMLVFLSELAMFTALVILSGRGDAPAISSIPPGLCSMTVMLLLFIAFGVKAGVLPFQSWMALSYQQAPIPAAVALAGAMVNAGMLGWLRFFPFGRFAMPEGAVIFIVIGGASVLYGVAFGLYQQKIGRVLASSSISQMGLASIIAGCGMFSTEAGAAAVTIMTLFAVHHTLAKTSLFLGYDMIDRGGRWKTIVLAAGLLAPSLSLAGFPLTSGAMLKGALKELTALGGEPWNRLGGLFLPVSSVATTLLMLHCVRLLLQLRAVRRSRVRTVTEILWLTSVFALAAVPWIWPPLRDLGSHSLQLHTIARELWPVIMGAVLAAGWFVSGSRLPGRADVHPDFDNLVRKLYERFMTVLGRVTDLIDIWRERLRPVRLRHKFPAVIGTLVRPGKWEKVLGRWSVVGFLYLLISITLFLMMLAGEMRG